MCEDKDKNELIPNSVLHGEPDNDDILFQDNSGLLDEPEDIEEEWPDENL
jgi:hypothetical protein